MQKAFAGTIGQSVEQQAETIAANVARLLETTPPRHWRKRRDYEYVSQALEVVRPHLAVSAQVSLDADRLHRLLVRLVAAGRVSLSPDSLLHEHFSEQDERFIARTTYRRQQAVYEDRRDATAQKQNR